MSSHCELAVIFPWVCNSKGELTATTAWWTYQDDLMNSLQLAHIVSCKLTESSQQAHSVSHLMSWLWGNLSVLKMSTPWVSMWAPSELDESSNSSLGQITTFKMKKKKINRQNRILIGNIWNKKPSITNIYKICYSSIECHVITQGEFTHLSNFWLNYN